MLSPAGGVNTLMGAKIKVGRADRLTRPTFELKSARAFGLADGGTGGPTDSGTDGSTDDSTRDGPRGGLLFNGRAASGSAEGDSGQDKGQCKAFHPVSSSNMVKPERRPRMWVPLESGELAISVTSRMDLSMRTTVFRVV